jgi:hypothetical protein
MQQANICFVFSFLFSAPSAHVCVISNIIFSFVSSSLFSACDHWCACLFTRSSDVENLDEDEVFLLRMRQRAHADAAAGVDAVARLTGYDNGNGMAHSDPLRGSSPQPAAGYNLAASKFDELDPVLAAAALASNRSQRQLSSSPRASALSALHGQQIRVGKSTMPQSQMSPLKTESSASTAALASEAAESEANAMPPALQASANDARFASDADADAGIHECAESEPSTPLSAPQRLADDPAYPASHAAKKGTKQHASAVDAHSYFTTEATAARDDANVRTALTVDGRPSSSQQSPAPISGISNQQQLPSVSVHNVELPANATQTNHRHSNASLASPVNLESRMSASPTQLSPISASHFAMVQTIQSPAAASVRLPSAKPSSAAAAAVSSSPLSSSHSSASASAVSSSLQPDRVALAARSFQPPAQWDAASKSKSVDRSSSSAGMSSSASSSALPLASPSPSSSAAKIGTFRPSTSSVSRLTASADNVSVNSAASMAIVAPLLAAAPFLCGTQVLRFVFFGDTQSIIGPLK